MCPKSAINQNACLKCTCQHCPGQISGTVMWNIILKLVKLVPQIEVLAMHHPHSLTPMSPFTLILLRLCYFPVSVSNSKRPKGYILVMVRHNIIVSPDRVGDTMDHACYSSASASSSASAYAEIFLCSTYRPHSLWDLS